MITLNIVLLCAFVAVAKSQSVQLEPYYDTYNSSTLHPDNYLNAHRRQQLANIWMYDYQIETFKTLFTERINTIEVQQKLLLNALIQTDKEIYPVELLNDFDKNCVTKYKSSIPPVSAVKYNLDRCIATANSQLNPMISSPSSTNRTLQNYYLNNFEKSVQTCEKNFANTEANLTSCYQNAVYAANVYTISNQKTFATQMDTAASSAQVHVKIALECSFGVHNSTIASTTQATTSIDRCINGLDSCNRCTGYYCDNVYYIPASRVNYKNQSMINVFYGSNSKVKCMMLDVTN